MDSKSRCNFPGKTNWLLFLLIVVSVTAMCMVSGCTEDGGMPGDPEGETSDSYEEDDDRVTVPEGLRVNEWEIIIDRVQIDLENTGDSGVFVNKLSVDIYVDDNLSVSKHYESELNTELAPGEVRIFTIGIQNVRDLDRARLKAIEIT